MDTKSASIRGPIAKQENAEKKKTMNDPGTPRLPRSRTMVYATPAAKPPIRPTKAGKMAIFAPVGLITRSAPTNAATTTPIWNGRNLSPSIAAPNSIAKKGDILLSMVASARRRWSTAWMPRTYCAEGGPQQQNAPIALVEAQFWPVTQKDHQGEDHCHQIAEKALEIPANHLTDARTGSSRRKRRPM